MLRILILSVILLAMICVPTAQDRSKSPFNLVGVILDEQGDLFLESVEVSLVCSGAVLQKSFSKPDGQFAFTLADNKNSTSGNIETAGSPSGGGFRTFNQMGRGLGDSGSHGSGRVSKFGRINLSDCEITAALPGFGSSVISLGIRDLMDSPDVGSVVLHRLEGMHGTTVSLKSFQAPEKARKPYRKAREELGREKINYPKAMMYLEKAVKAYPGFARAWYELGKCHLIAGDSDSASQAFQASFEADPQYLPPLVELADMALRAGRVDEAAVVSGYIVSSNSEVVRTHYIRAWAEHGRGNIELARESILSVQGSQDAQKYPGSNYLLGMILETQGENEQAASRFRQFVEAQPNSPDAGHLRRLLDSWELQGLIPPGVSEPR